MSTIKEIADEITGKLAVVEGIVAYAWDVPRIATTPAVLVGLPERITYRTTYGGTAQFDLDMVVLVGKANMRAGTENLLRLLERDGDRSVFRLVDSKFTTYTTCSDVTVMTAEPDVFRNAGNDYLGAEFALSVTT